MNNQQLIQVNIAVVAITIAVVVVYFAAVAHFAVVVYFAVVAVNILVFFEMTNQQLIQVNSADNVLLLLLHCCCCC